jgi:hypothetical protein
MERIFYALHGTLDSYLRDDLQEGIAKAVAWLHVPRANACGGFLFFSFFCLVGITNIFSIPFPCKELVLRVFINYRESRGIHQQ